MVGHYAQAWTKRYGESPISAQGEVTSGALGFIEAMAGLSRAQIEEGLQALVRETSEFPPAPARFRVLCLQIPSYAEVQVDLSLPFEQRLPFTVMVCNYLDGFAYKRATTTQQERMLRSAYELARDRRLKGEPLPTTGRATLEPPKERPPVYASDELRAWWEENIRRILAGEPEQDPSTKPKDPAA